MERKRKAEKLTPIGVKQESRPGYHGDGNGLWLQVSASGTKSWVFRFTLHGKAREMGLGALHAFSLKEARERAAQCRKLLADGKDPLADRQARQQAEKLEAAKVMTFSECVDGYLAAHDKGWKNPKHRQQWRNTLSTYALPTIGAVSVNLIDTATIMKILDPLWLTKTETATRLRGRIESVLDWAAVREYRQGENPARWKGHLDQLLPARSKVQKVIHHAALPFAEMGGFMADLRQQPGMGARALEFCILTATRSGEVRGATWGEINLDAGMWTIPGERMKAKKAHRVPLVGRALEIVKEMQESRLDAFVFPGKKEGKGLSDMTLTAVLRRMERSDLTAHGFRSSFRDWTAEATAYPREVCEMALAHTVSDAVEAAYRRGDLFTKRVRLMQDWAKWCETGRTTGEIVPLRQGTTGEDA